MKRFRYFSDLGRLPCFIIMAVVFSWGILAMPSSGEVVSTSGEKNTLVVALPASIMSLDPTNYRHRPTQAVLKNMFDSLTTRDAGMKVVPQLAESWQVLDDTTWEFKLRRGVKFHNGDDFSAQDVKFTLERVVKEGALDGETSPRKSLLGLLSQVNIINDYTVQIKTEKPWPILPLMLTLQEIIPKKYMEEVGSQEFQRNPIGTGPFKFVRAEGKEGLILERFEGYYGGSAENPPMQVAPLKYLVFKTVPVEAERIAMLKTGELDIIYNMPSGVVPLLWTAPGIKVIVVGTTRSYFVEINSIKPPFDDLRIRLALNYAVDMKTVVDSVLQGHGEVLSTVLLPYAFAYHGSLEPYPYDAELARKLLNDSGFPEEHSITIHSIKDDAAFANVIAVFLLRVGVKSVINIVDNRRPKTVGKDAGWDLFLGSWGNTTLDPVGILVPKFRSGGRGNFSGYSNEEVDKLLSQAESALDYEIRANYYRTVQEIIYQDVPMIFGYAAEEFYGVRKRVKNFVPSSGGMTTMHDVYLENGS